MSIRELPLIAKCTVATGVVEVQFQKVESELTRKVARRQFDTFHKIGAESMQLVEAVAHLCKEGILLKLG